MWLFGLYGGYLGGLGMFRGLGMGVRALRVLASGLYWVSVGEPQAQVFHYTFFIVYNSYSNA